MTHAPAPSCSDRYVSSVPSSTRLRRSVPALAQLNMDPEQPMPVVGDGAFLADLPAGAIDTVLTLAGPGVDTPVQTSRFDTSAAPWRGGPGRRRPAKNDAKDAMFAAGFTPTPELVHATRTRVSDLKDALTVWHAGYDYYNFAETPAEAEVVLPGGSYERLQRIKASYDPDQMIVSAHPVRPFGA